MRKPTDEIIPIPSHHKGQSLSIDEGSEGSNHSDPMRVNYLKQSEVDVLGKEPVRDHTLLHGNLIYAIEPSRDDSLHESKLFMNALSLLNMREEMFLKILKDPSSSLASQMHCRHPNLRFGLNKSMSFSAPAPLPAPSDTRDSEVDASMKTDEQRDEQLSREAEAEAEPPDTASAVRKKSDDRVGLMHFKNIREKIKYVIRDRKKDKNRIMMDALHHKIPYGTNASKKLSEDIEHQGSDFGNSSAQPYKRTSSFDNSLDRYNQLLDKSSTKDHISEESSKLKIADAKPTTTTTRKKRATLGRILSSPEIRSYSRANIDEEPDTVGVSGKHENQEEVSLLGGEAADSKAEEEEEEGSPHPSPQPSKQETEEVSVNDKDEASGSRHHTPTKDDSSDLLDIHIEPHEMESWFLSQDMIDLEMEEGELDLFESHVSEDAVGIVQESQIQQFYSDLMHVEVDAKNKAEFNYVKGVLELSGFSRNETLGEWQSAEHPLDPSMFEEVGGDQQDYYGNEEVICNQLMLFDLINEVLLQVHERSFCYWPTPLTNRSTIHPLPKGSRVLEEVWAEIRWLLRSMPDSDDDDTDDAVSRDLAKNDGWMNLQLDAECVGIELEELIFDDLLQQLFAA